MKFAFSLRRRLFVFSLLTAIMVLGFTSAGQAQRQCRVSPTRARQLITRYNQYRAEKIRIANRYNALKQWCNRNWRFNRTRQYRRFKAEMKKLHIRYNWVKHYQNQIKATYYGRTHGWVISYGNPEKNKKRTGNSGGNAVNLLNQRANGTNR